ncbi:MAG: NAD(P)-dependent oxidoreductase, partial [Bacteroidales bacterium]|nr:NAD(P)-dependent oxidoreductase [Bacteroidales bacterium]
SYSGNPAERLVWECHRGHRFQASPVLILEGGHWCPDCLPPPWEDEEMAAKSPFFRQIFR